MNVFQYVLLRVARARSAVLRGAVAALALIAFGCVTIVAYSYYRTRLQDNSTWVSEVKIERESRLAASIFDITKDLFPLFLERSTGRLLIADPPCEQRILKPATGPEAAKRRVALDLLCTSPQGEQLRAEIDRWNTSYDFLAVRDNRWQDSTCDHAIAQQGVIKLTAEVYVPYGCKPNAWSVRLGSANGISAVWTPSAEPPPSDYGFIVDKRDPIRFAGDWARISPNIETSSTHYFLQTEMPLPRSGRVAIDLVGRLRAVSIDGEQIAVHLTEASCKSYPMKGVTVTVCFSCFVEEAEASSVSSVDDSAEDVETATSDSERPACLQEPAGKPRPIRRRPAKPKPAPYPTFAYKVVLEKRGASSARPMQITLEAEPAANLPPALRSRQSAGFALRRDTRHLKAVCPEDALRRRAAVTNCTLEWDRIEDVEQRGKSKFSIVARTGNDAHELVSPETGLITTEAFELGLSPLIGLGPGEWGSLSAALAMGTGVPADARQSDIAMPLTIVPGMQRKALDILRDSSPCKSAEKCQGEDAERTATLVVLDADAEPGAIRVMASWPPVPKQLHLWDLAALSEEDSAQAGLGWRAVKADNVPGSTFKAVTSFAAITAATVPGLVRGEDSGDLKNFRSLLLGGLGQSEEMKFLKIRWAPVETMGRRSSWKINLGGKRHACEPEDARGRGNTITVPDDDTQPTYCGQNFGRHEFWDPKPQSATHCPDNSAGKSQFGMCEALTVSSNLFFGGTARRLLALTSSTNADEILLSRAARRITYGENVLAAPMPCDGTPLRGRNKRTRPAWTRPEGTRAGFDLTRGSVKAPKLMADPIRVRVSQPECAKLDGTGAVQSGWGDSVSATPLAMATVYASLAKRSIVRPALVTVPRGPDGCPVKKADPAECGELIPGAEGVEPFLEVLRAGLHAVPTVGSAASAFNIRTGGDARGLLNDANGKPRLFAKTGTATVIARRRFSVWTAGWIEGAAGTGIPNRLAFACFVTHVHDGSEATGGRICAPIVRNFLLSLANERRPR